MKCCLIPYFQQYKQVLFLKKKIFTASTKYVKGKKIYITDVFKKTCLAEMHCKSTERSSPCVRVQPPARLHGDLPGTGVVSRRRLVLSRYKELCCESLLLPWRGGTPADTHTHTVMRPAQQPSGQRGSATSAAVHQNQTGSRVMSALFTAYLL